MNGSMFCELVRKWYVVECFQFTRYTRVCTIATYSIRMNRDMIPIQQVGMVCRYTFFLCKINRCTTPRSSGTICSVEGMRDQNLDGGLANLDSCQKYMKFYAHMYIGVLRSIF